jgi:hypothetical protein
MCVTALLIRISIVENACKEAMLSETAFLSRTSKVRYTSVSFESSFQVQPSSRLPQRIIL